MLITASTFFAACSNSNTFETGEIKALRMLEAAIVNQDRTKIFVDTKKIVTRKKIDKAQIPVLYIQLESGQNGTLTLYPGQGDGETWLGADGSTVTLDQGILKATRGMKMDLMGSNTSMPVWKNLNGFSTYNRQVVYLGGNNQLHAKSFSCEIKTEGVKTFIRNLGVSFKTQLYNETCFNNEEIVNNIYFVDNKHIVRKSVQYHSPALGYLTIERLDRLK